MNTAVLYFVELLVLAPSNYVLQIVIGTTIHYGYGLGLYGKVGAVQGFVLSVAVFAMQMLLSALYLARLPDGSAGVAVAADFARAAGGCRLTRIAKFKPGEPAAEPARTRD